MGGGPRRDRAEKAAETSFRSRVWSGGSTVNICRANSGPGSPSATTSEPLANAACMSFDRRGSLRADFASSKRTTSQASWPSASVTGCTGPRARACANTEKGSSMSNDPQDSNAFSIVTSHLSLVSLLVSLARTRSSDCLGGQRYACPPRPTAPHAAPRTQPRRQIREPVSEERTGWPRCAELFA